MIKTVKVDNYKCLTSLAFCTRNLTLLTGTNSVGKSSFIQALLLSRMACLNSNAGHIISLNGPYGLTLGEYVDILRHEATAEAGVGIRIVIITDIAEYDLLLTADVDTARYAKFEYKAGPPPLFCSTGLGSFCYLSAEREGPRDSTIVQSVPREQMEIGFRGQYVADVLQVCERDPVHESLEFPTVIGQRLLKQTEAWLSNFVPGVEIRAEKVQEMDTVLLRFKRGGIESEWERPSNTGFGVSYCLPIVVAGLVAKQGSVLIVDSPEAHLHPSAQSKMGSFLGRLAASGVQVIIETHSDHVVNGIRLAAIDDMHPLQREEVIINHLQQIEGKTVKHEITIDPHGSLSSRPIEFFDQAEKDLAAIVKRRFGSSQDE